MEKEKETNLEHYKERLKRILKMGYKDPQTVFHDIKASIDPEIQRTSDFFTSSILDWMAQEYKPELLDKVEENYLSEVISPFRKEVTAIKKLEVPSGREYILIILKDDSMHFPCFEKGRMYKGMKLEKRYTPEELGL